MEWLTQNWLWLLLVGGVIVMMTRGGMGCGFMGGRSHREGNAAPGDGDALHSGATSPIDPVTGEAVDPGSAVSSGHHGRIYYFASRENRDRFEQSPDRYATAGGPTDGEPGGHRHQRHGC